MKKSLLFLFSILMLSASSFAKEELLSQYEFTKNNKKIVYDNNELRFYQIINEEKLLLTQDEIQKLFPDYQIITISDFDKNKKLKIKNSVFGKKKILVLNDRNRTFHGFEVYPISSRDELPELKNLENKAVIKSLMTIYGKKDARIKHPGGDSFEIIVK